MEKRLYGTDGFCLLSAEQFSGYIVLFGRGLRFEGGIAEIMERRRAFTTSEDLKTAATSGSNTTATVPSDIFAAKRFGLDLA